MKNALKLSAAFLTLTVQMAIAQELPAVATNVDLAPWVRATENPPLSNRPWNFGALPSPCSFSHMKFDDPIRKPGQTGTSALHVFFGNTLTNGNSTYASLRSSGEGTCYGGPANRSAYFLPSVMNAVGKAVLPDFLEVTHKGWATTKPFPRGLKMIFGYDDAAPQAWDLYNHNWAWSFSASGNFPPPKTHWGSINLFKSLSPASVPAWAWNGGSSYPMSLRVVAPACWDGKNLDSLNHRSHMNYGTKDSTGKITCPTSHPVLIPEVAITAFYKNMGQADVSGWYLSSDKFGGKNLPAGTNLYAGMIPAWDDGVMNAWVTKILNTGKYGSFGKIGDGRILEKPLTSQTFAPTASIKPAYFLWRLQTVAGQRGATVSSHNNLVDPP